MVMISYNEAVDTEVMEVLSSCGLESYTKVAGVFGKGAVSGAHLGTDIWPGKNNILYIACEEEKARQLISCVREMRDKIGKEGVKAFLLPVEETT